MKRLKKYLQDEGWDEEPMVYSDMLDDIVPDHTKLPETLKPLYDQCLIKSNDYEDNYEWD